MWVNTSKGKLSIALRLDANGEVVGINNISSVHSKDASTEIDRLYEMGTDFGKSLKYVDKEKVSNWLMSSVLLLIQFVPQGSGFTFVVKATYIIMFIRLTGYWDDRPRDGGWIG